MHPQLLTGTSSGRQRCWEGDGAVWRNLCPPQNIHMSPCHRPGRKWHLFILTQIYLLCSSLTPSPPGARDALSLAPTNPPVLRNALCWCRFGGLPPVRGELGLMEYPFFLVSLCEQLLRRNKTPQPQCFMDVTALIFLSKQAADMRGRFVNPAIARG